MNNVFNRDNNKKWVRPWNLEKFDDLYNRDERFFSIIMKGLISWLNRNILMYNKSINHFVFNTGSSYLYVESNGYEYNVSEVTGEDSMYMQLPRCIIEINSVHVPMEELTSPFSRGNYERRDGNLIRGYNAEIQRLPLEISIKLSYYLGTFNESLILLQEIIDKIVFQQYFNVTYLGNIIQCSIQFQADAQTQINKIDMTSPDPNQRLIELEITVDTNYPVINERSEIPTDKVIETFGYEVDLYLHNHKGDIIKKGNIISDDDGFKEFENNLVNEKEGYIFNQLNELNESNQGSNEGSNQGSNEGSNQGSNEGSNQGSNEGSNQGSNEGSNQGSNEGSNQGSNEGSNQGSNEGSNQGSNEGSNQGSNEGSQNNEIIIKTGIDINNINDKFIKNFDFNNDGIIDINDLINKYDINGDGVIDEYELINLLEKIKYELYDDQTDYTEQCHYRIDYKDIYYAIKLINLQSNVSAHYDKFTKKIYVTHNDTGNITEIDLIKYKIINNE